MSNDSWKLNNKVTILIYPKKRENQGQQQGGSCKQMVRTLSETDRLKQEHETIVLKYHTKQDSQ